MTISPIFDVECSFIKFELLSSPIKEIYTNIIYKENLPWLLITVIIKVKMKTNTYALNFILNQHIINKTIYVLKLKIT